MLNNNYGGGYSFGVELIPPVSGFTYSYSAGTAYAPANYSSTYQMIEETFYTLNMGSVYKLPNGAYFMCDADSGMIYEINSSGEICWKYSNPYQQSGLMTQGQTPDTYQGGNRNSLFRAIKYPIDYGGFSGRTFKQQGVIEIIP